MASESTTSWLNVVTREGVLRPGFRAEALADGRFSIVSNSAGGKDARGYATQLEILLSRLSDMNAQISRIEVESMATSHLSSTDRVLDLPFPIQLNSDTDTVSLRQKISAAQRPVGQKPGVRGGIGNRRIRIDVDAGKQDIVDFLRRLSLQQELPIQRSADVEDRELEEDAIEDGYRSRLLGGSLESLQLIRARRGQGAFRRNVLSLEPRCRITGVADQRLLRASHIKPWRLSSDEEKLDGNNGLMLSPHADALFDQGMISFRADGRLIVSRQLDDLVLHLWRISTSLNVGKFTEQQSKYLRFHQENILA